MAVGSEGSCDCVSGDLFDVQVIKSPHSEQATPTPKIRSGGSCNCVFGDSFEVQVIKSHFLMSKCIKFGVFSGL